MAENSPSGISEDVITALAADTAASVRALLALAGTKRFIAGGEAPLMGMSLVDQTAARAAALASAQGYEHSARVLAGVPDPA